MSKRDYMCSLVPLLITYIFFWRSFRSAYVERLADFRPLIDGWFTRKQERAKDGHSARVDSRWKNDGWATEIRQKFPAAAHELYKSEHDSHE